MTRKEKGHVKRQKNGIPTASSDDRLLQQFCAGIDPSHPSAMGQFVVFVDDSIAGSGPTKENAVMQAETLYRYFSGIVSVKNRFGEVLFSK